MGLIRLADALTDFGVVRLDVPEPEPVPAPFIVAESAPQPAPFDPAELIADAVRRAEEALRSSLRKEHEAELAALNVRHAEQLAELEARLASEAGANIATAFAGVGERVVEVTGAAVARLLAPMLADDLARRSLAGLAQAITSALDDGTAVRLHLRGPRPMFEQLAERLGERAAAVQFEERDGVDLTLAVGDALYETRLGEWSSGLAEMLR